MKLHGYFNNGMLIKADTPFFVIGFSKNLGEDITATLSSDNSSYSSSTTVDNTGAFYLPFPKISASFTPYTLVVKSNSESITVTDILFGDLFLMTGQSNMAYKLKYHDSEKLIHKKYSSKFVRALRIENVVLKASSYGLIGLTENQRDFLDNAKWNNTTDYDKVLSQSAFSFIFSGKTFSLTNRPVGYIDISVGGSSVENWYSRSFQQSENGIREYDDRLTLRDGLSRVGSIYTEKLCPVKNINFTGVIFYQGENNCYNRFDSDNYAKMFTGFLSELRDLVGFHTPVTLVNLAMHKNTPYTVSIVNDQLFAISEQNENMLTIPQYDLKLNWIKDDGDFTYHPIHPTKKEEIAVRCANAFYNKFIIKNEFSYPKIIGLEFNEDYILVTTSNKAPLKTKDNKKVFGFTIANEDKKFFVANAKIISANKIKVYSPFVKSPKYISYAFYDLNSTANLVQNDLPILPYYNGKLTDDFILTSPSPVYECTYDKVYVSTGNSEFGGMFNANLWSKPSICYDKGNKVKVTNNGVLVKYKANVKNFYRAGVSPNLSVDGLDNGLSTFNKLRVTLISDKDLTFDGFICKTPKNTFMFKPLNAIINKNIETTIVFDLSTALLHNGFSGEITTSDKSLIYKGQFSFIAKPYSKGKILIKKVELFD